MIQFVYNTKDEALKKFREVKKDGNYWCIVHAIEDKDKYYVENKPPFIRLNETLLIETS